MNAIVDFLRCLILQKHLKSSQFSIYPVASKLNGNSMYYLKHVESLHSFGKTDLILSEKLVEDILCLRSGEIDVLGQLGGTDRLT